MFTVRKNCIDSPSDSPSFVKDTLAIFRKIFHEDFPTFHKFQVGKVVRFSRCIKNRIVSHLLFHARLTPLRFSLLSFSVLAILLNGDFHRCFPLLSSEKPTSHFHILTLFDFSLFPPSPAPMETSDEIFFTHNVSFPSVDKLNVLMNKFPPMRKLFNPPRLSNRVIFFKKIKRINFY